MRSLNLAQNQLTRFPTLLERTLIILNISFNKLKSLTGIESCVNLKFLNASGNQLAYTQGIIYLQSLRELVLAQNQLQVLKDISQLKNLQLLDVSYNRLMDFEKLQPLKVLKKLTTLCLVGNFFEQQLGKSYEVEVKRVVPTLTALDPLELRDFS